MMKRVLISAAMAAVLLTVTAVVILQSDWFADKLERRLVQEISRATGASVRIGRVSIDWKKLQFLAAPVTLHGTEPAGSQPLLRASEVEVGLSFRSFLKQSVDIAFLRILKPNVHLIVQADGSTNIPGGGGGLTATETLIHLAVGHFEMKDGIAHVNEKKIPLNVDAQGIHAALIFEPADRRYRGNIEIGRILNDNVPIALESAFSFATDRADIQRLRIATPTSSLQGTGWFTNWRAVRGELNLDIDASLPEVSKWANLSLVEAGQATGKITGTLEPDRPWEWKGQIQGRNISATIANKKVKDIHGSAALAVQGDVVSLRNVQLHLLGGTFEGQADIHQPDRYRVKGRLENVQTFAPLSATASGPIEIEGKGEKPETVIGQIRLTPRPGKIPVGGNISARYLGANEQLIFDPSSLQLGESELNLQGSIQNGLAVELRTRNLQELLPAARLLSPEISSDIDASLENSWTTVQATVKGTPRQPILSGTATIEKLKTMDETLERISTHFNTDSSHLQLTNLSFRQRGVAVSGELRMGLTQWQLTDQSTVAGTANFSGATLESLLSNGQKIMKTDLPIRGVASGQLRISGTVQDPHGTGTLRITQAVVVNEPLDSVTADFVATRKKIDLSKIRGIRGSSTLEGQGTWTPGIIAFDLRTANWNLARYLPEKISGTASGTLQGRLKEVAEGWTFESLNGTLKASAKDQGELTVRASSSDGALHLTAQGNLKGAQLSSESSWKLADQMPGSGTIKLTGLTPAILHQFTATGDSLAELPFNGKLEGSASFQGNFLEPDLLTGRAVFPVIELTPKQENIGQGMIAADLTLHNEGDVVLVAGPRGVVVERAKFRAKDTEIEASGNLSFRRANTWNLLVRGSVNLAAISTFRPDLTSTGTSTLDARIRGTFDDPQVEGRMQFNNASLSLREVPNGLDKVNGTILFDRTRANIESLSAESGGGNVAVTGYVGFGTELSYQLAAQLNQVRVRYPEGVSSQSNATLTLTGSSRRSLLSGTVTILRAGLTPQTDASGMLGRSSRPLDTVPTGEFLRGLQFDVRIETAQSAEVSTQLTKNIQADAELRLRGTPSRPVLLGRASVTQGEVQFFGTDYKINRGEVTFVNPVTIEPRIDMDLETRVRGIAVSINFSGPLNKLNMSYRSDPPLQSSEILALLAVGRTPTAATALGVGTINGQGLLSGGAGGGNAILNSALSAPTNSNLQRFFGVTRLKIDPQLIGMDNTPQARMSLEQPISRDVTVTYVQMLSRAQGQMVRVQWDLSREWSALATRDENGVLSVDFIFKRSFR